MSASFILQASGKFLLGVLLVGALIFLPAGTLCFWNGWVFLIILFVPMLVVGIVMAVKNPTLLQKRLNAKETEHEQSVVVKLSGLMFIGGFVVAGFGHRFKWYALPKSVVIVASVLFLIAYIVYAEVLRENTYLSRAVEVQEGQTVIDTGLYGIVRHPMYSATLLLFLSMPLVLGSLYAFVIFWAYPFIIAKRIRNEEEVLGRRLTGYREYCEKVKYRLIPFVW